MPVAAVQGHCVQAAPPLLLIPRCLRRCRGSRRTRSVLYTLDVGSFFEVLCIWSSATFTPFCRRVSASCRCGRNVDGPLQLHRLCSSPTQCGRPRSGSDPSTRDHRRRNSGRRRSHQGGQWAPTPRQLARSRPPPKPSWPMVEAPAGNRLLPAPLKIPQTRFTVISKRGGGLVLHPRDRLRASAWDKVGAWLHRRGAGICRRQKMPRN